MLKPQVVHHMITQDGPILLQLAYNISSNIVLPLNPTRAKTPIPVGEPYGRYDGILYLKESPAPIFGALGVLTNGVMVFGVGSPCGYSSKCPEDGAPTKYVDAVESEGHTVDQCGGHAAPTNQYHIHSNYWYQYYYWSETMLS